MTARPLAVSLYFCRRLLGLSGTVISIKPAASSGLRTWSLNLVRLDLPATVISTPIALAVLHL